MRTSEIRQRFFKFFERKDHRIMRSDPLIPPAEDKSLLFTGAGMNQFKSEFTGRGEPGLKRAVTSQKCFRTDDIEIVGKTAYHLTFFEMLGNFSFGDYFKREAIIWAWEFLIEDMGIPAERLCVSVYEDDDESFGIWQGEIGLSADIIYRYGEHDNFWPADAPKLGPNGLCGPCTEIFYDWGPELGCLRPECEPACDCDRYCEIWNLVLQQFERKDEGILVPLPTKNIDTGMGLERMAAVMQNKMSNFDTDLFVPIMSAVERETDREYAPVRDAREGISFRRIADHVRAAVFCIGDGVLPGNTGRGYVLRKLLRRAVLDGGRLGRSDPFLYRLVPTVTEVMSDQYPDLVERRENIARLVRVEEERFLHTLEQGRVLLDTLKDDLRRSDSGILPGDEAFRLFDTCGLPLDITESVLEDDGFKVDKEGFEREMARQRELSRKGTRISEDIFGGGPVAGLRERGCTSLFRGYEQDEVRGKVVGIVAGQELVDEIEEGAEAAVVLERTTFYGEAGGEVGDAGVLESDDVRFVVNDTQRCEGLILHVGTLERGRIRSGDTLTARPDGPRRSDIRRNHTATHLLHLALREVLGTHVEQAGSLVAPDRLRFDFTHTQSVTQEELRLVEDKVNVRVLRNDAVTWRITSLEKAKAEGAMALFGEKYADDVRLLDIGGYSKELCGGLHSAATGEIGHFKIVAESSVAAGVRRIEAVTGMGAVRAVREKEDLLRSVSRILGAQEPRVVEKADQLTGQLKELRKELQKARQTAGPAAADYLKSATDIAGTKVITANVPDADSDALRALVDQLRGLAPSVAVTLGTVSDGRVLLIVGLTKDLVGKGVHAGDIARQAAKIVGGGGGGRPDIAQAGGRDPAALDQALKTAADLISQSLEASSA